MKKTKIVKVKKAQLKPELRKEIEELEKELRQKEKLKERTWKDMKILWFSVAPYIRSGYGVVTRNFVSRLIKRGFTMMIVAYYGLAKGGFLKVGDMVCFPTLTGPGDPLGFKSVAQHHKKFGTDFVLFFTDFWVARALTKYVKNTVAYTVLDHVDYADKYQDVLRSFAKVAIASKFGVKEARKYGVDACYDEETRVLTDKGFKFFRELTVEDRIGTLNEKGFLQFVKPSNYFVFPWKGSLIKWKSRYYDLKVTPNHNVYVRKRGKKAFELLKAKDLFGKTRFEIKRNFKWKGKDRKFFYLPKIDLEKTNVKDGRFKTRNYEKFRMKDWVEFLGWYLSEGCLEQPYRVIIAQNNKTNNTQIQKLLRRMGIPFYTKKQNTQIIISSKQLVSYLKKFGRANEKFVPREIKELTKNCLERFIIAFAKGDGSFNKGKIRSISTTSERLALDLAEILLKTGRGVVIRKNEKYEKKYGHPKWILNISYETLTPIVKDRGKLETYEGFVYDVTVPNHLLLVERNGRIYWSGNSFIPHGVDLNAYHPLPKEPCKQMIGVKPSTFVLGIVAANNDKEPRKGWDMMFKAIKTFLDNNPKMKDPDKFRVFIHSDPQNPRGYDLKLLSKRTGIGKFIIFQDPYMSIIGLPDPLMNRVFNSFDVLMNLARREGFCLPILEAQACGVPAIATDFSAMTERLDYGKCGWLVKPVTTMLSPLGGVTAIPDHAKAAEALEEAVFNKKKRKLFAKRSLAYAKKQTWDIAVDKYWMPFLEEVWNDLDLSGKSKKAKVLFNNKNRRE